MTANGSSAGHRGRGAGASALVRPMASAPPTVGPIRIFSTHKRNLFPDSPQSPDTPEGENAQAIAYMIGHEIAISLQNKRARSQEKMRESRDHDPPRPGFTACPKRSAKSKGDDNITDSPSYTPFRRRTSRAPSGQPRSAMPYLSIRRVGLPSMRSMKLLIGCRLRRRFQFL